MLLVVVPLVQAFVCAWCAGREGPVVTSSGVEGRVVVDRDPVDVVDAAEEVVYRRVRGERGDIVCVGGTIPLTLEADEDVYLGGVLGLEALGLDDVGVVARAQYCERGCRVVAELAKSLVASQ